MPSKADISRVMAAMGRKGGRKGGKRRLDTMTAEQRSDIALKAARARWAKVADGQEKLNSFWPLTSQLPARTRSIQ